MGFPREGGGLGVHREGSKWGEKEKKVFLMPPIYKIGAFL